MTRLPPYRFLGRTAVVTGAASGIGEELAYELARRDSNLVLVDKDEQRLLAVADHIRGTIPGLVLKTIVADLADRSAVDRVAKQILAGHPGIGLLVNNAGVALAGRFDQISVAQFETVMNVNFMAPMLLTHALLPALRAEPGSHLVNVSSLFGLIAPAGQSAYSSSKFALRGLSQALHGELATVGVGVTTVHPGGVRTRIAENSIVGTGVSAESAAIRGRAFNAILTYSPERAARRIADAVASRKSRLLIARSARVPDALARLTPAGHMALMRTLGMLPRAK